MFHECFSCYSEHILVGTTKSPKVLSPKFWTHLINLYERLMFDTDGPPFMESVLKIKHTAAACSLRHCLWDSVTVVCVSCFPHHVMLVMAPASCCNSTAGWELGFPLSLFFPTQHRWWSMGSVTYFSHSFCQFFHFSGTSRLAWSVLPDLVSFANQHVGVHVWSHPKQCKQHPSTKKDGSKGRRSFISQCCCVEAI